VDIISVSSIKRIRWMTLSFSKTFTVTGLENVSRAEGVTSNLAFMAENHDSGKPETPMPGGGHLASHEVLESLVW